MNGVAEQILNQFADEPSIAQYPALGAVEFKVEVFCGNQRREHHGGFAGQVAEMAAFLNALALPLLDFREQQHLIGELDGTFYRF